MTRLCLILSIAVLAISCAPDDVSATADRVAQTPTTVTLDSNPSDPTQTDRTPPDPSGSVPASEPSPVQAEPATTPTQTQSPTPAQDSAEPSETAGGGSASPPPRIGIDVYRGLGAWVDVFDWAPAYAGAPGPAVTPGEVAEMAAHGVSTIYFQSSRFDDRGTGDIQNPALVAEFLRAAHELDVAVVGWYLPTWEDAEVDLARMVAIAEFARDGQSFDGVAVDIEGVPTVAQRADWNRRVIALSQQLRARVGERAIGAIVLPPTLLEEVNPEYWPNFPWQQLSGSYDVWLPMSYWSFRDDDSPFANGYDYNADATRRLRVNIDDDDAIVHAIGGIGASDDSDVGGESRAGTEELEAFVRSAVDTGAVGLSIYDWASQNELGRRIMSDAVAASPIMN